VNHRRQLLKVKPLTISGLNSKIYLHFSDASQNFSSRVATGPPLNFPGEAWEMIKYINDRGSPGPMGPGVPPRG